MVFISAARASRIDSSSSTIATTLDSCAVVMSANNKPCSNTRTIILWYNTGLALSPQGPYSKIYLPEKADFEPAQTEIRQGLLRGPLTSFMRASVLQLLRHFDKIGKCPGLHFLHDSRSMYFDGYFLGPKGGRNLLIEHPRRDQFHHLSFARC
jgi:hypothetical protein